MFPSSGDANDQSNWNNTHNQLDDCDCQNRAESLPENISLLMDTQNHYRIYQNRNIWVTPGALTRCWIRKWPLEATRRQIDIETREISCWSCLCINFKMAALGKERKTSFLTLNFMVHPSLIEVLSGLWVKGSGHSRCVHSAKTAPGSVLEIEALKFLKLHFFSFRWNDWTGVFEFGHVRFRCPRWFRRIL